MTDRSPQADTGKDTDEGRVRGWASSTSRWQKVVGIIGLVVLLGPGMGVFGPGSDQGGPGGHGPGGDTPSDVTPPVGGDHTPPEDGDHTPPVDFDDS